MTNEEMLETIKERAKDQDCFEIKSVMDVNHRPHPYTVGSKHIVHANKHYMGMLGKETMEAVGCAHPKCNLPYEQHTFDKVLFIQLKKNLTPDVAQEVIKSFMEPAIVGLDKLAFVDTPEKYRIDEALES